MFKVSMFVPRSEFEAFKQKVMSYFFIGDPVLTKHNAACTTDTIVCDFVSNIMADVKTVITMLPCGSNAYTVKPV